MADLKRDFKNWLLTVKKYKETTADRYRFIRNFELIWT